MRSRFQSWCDEKTRNKVRILGHDLTILQELIDPINLPKVYGGQLEWEYGCPPSLDEPAKAMIGDVPRCPCWFQDGRVVKSIDIEA
jgi:hypothetical protein